MPCEPSANVRCAAPQALPLALPVLTTNVPLAPLEQSENVPETAVFAFEGAAPAPVEAKPTTLVTARPAAAEPISTRRTTPFPIPITSVPSLLRRPARSNELLRPH